MTEHIGKYRVEKELGQGGFGKVYLAFDPDVGQPVAIKKLRAEGDPELLKRFHLEIRTTASLRHKNIVTIFASGEEAGDPYLVMEYLEGYTLKQIIQARRPLTLLEKVSIMTQVAEGLAYAHSKGVVHRDVKPENIMLLPDDTVKIMDFGIALGPERQTNVTQTGGIIGTPPYFAPEQLEGHKASEQTDIFSYGDVYYELLTGAHPFEAHKGDWRTLQLAILSYEPRPVGELVEGCPDALETLVHRTLAKQTEFRYQKFEEVRLDGEAIMVDLKHESAAAILREIPSLMESNLLQSALSRVRLAYQLEPGNREVRRLREEINLRLQGARRQEQIAELLASAEKQMNEGRFAEAVQSLEVGYRLDTNNVVVAGRLEEAKAKRDSYAQASRLISEARFKQQKGLLTEAHERIQEALSVDPGNADAKRLSQRIDEELKRRQLDQKLQQALHTAGEHRAAQRFAEGLATLDEMERDLPGNAAVAELRSDILREQDDERRRARAERFHHAINMTREVIDAAEFDRARQMLDHLVANFASEPGANEMLAPLRERLDHLVRAREVAQHQHNVRALVKDKCFREALDVLAEALKQFPGDAGLERLNQTVEELYRAQQRSDAVAAVLHEAGARRDAGDLQGALNAIMKGRQQLGDEAAFTDLARLVEMEISQQRYSAGLEALLKESRSLLAAGSYSGAIDRLTSCGEYAAEAEVRALLESARAEAAIEEERSFIENTLASASKLQSQESWTKALSAVELGLARYPQNPKLTRTADRLRERVERERVHAAIEAHRAAIKREMEGGRWNRAQAGLQKARAEFPGDAAFDDLSDQIEAGLYEEGWRELNNRIERDLKNNALSNAEASLDHMPTRTVYQTDPRWKALAEQVSRRRNYENALAEAERRRKDGALSEAERLLTEVMNQGPPDTRAAQMRGAIQSQRSEALRQKEIARVAESIRALLAKDDVAQAASELAAVRSRYPGESCWTSLEADLDARQQALRRTADIAAAEEGVRKALGGDDIRQAQALLKTARGKFSGEPVWHALEKLIAERQAILTRESEIAAAAASIRRWLATDHTADQPKTVTVPNLHQLVLNKRLEDLRTAADELSAVRAKYPGEGLWKTLEAEINARQQFLAAEGRIKDGISDRLGRGEFAQAEAQVAAARAQYPDEHFWNMLAGGIARQRQFWLEREEVARFAESIQNRLNNNSPADARSELETARAKYPARPEWKELQTAIDARQAEIDKRTAIAELAERLRSQFEQEMQRVLTAEAFPLAAATDALRNAGARLEQARARYPGEAVWDGLQGGMAAYQTRIDREAADGIRACNNLAALDAHARQVATARSRYPDDARWTVLEQAIQARREPLERASIAGFETGVRDALAQGDLQSARARLDGARRQHPSARQWAALEKEIDARQAEIKRREELDAAERGVREQLEEVAHIAVRAELMDPIRQQWTAFESARARVENAGAKFPGEARLDALRSEITSRRRQWETEIAQGISDILRNQPAKGFSAAPVMAEIGAMKAREPGNPLWARLKSEIDATEARLAKQEEVAAIAGRVRASLGRDDIRQAISDLGAARAKYQGEAAWSTLQSEIDAWQAREQQRKRELRNRDRDRLLVIEQEVQTAAQNRQRKKLNREARTLAAGYPEDHEIAAIAARVHQLAEAAPARAADARPFPWKFAAIGAGSAAIALAGLAFFLHSRSAEPPKPPPVATIAVEVRTDPPGATVRVGNRSCTTPNCRLDVAPGSYLVEAMLSGYETKRQTVQMDAANRLVDLTLNPVAPPEPEPQTATGTVIVHAGLPDALVYVDNVPQRSRTDQTGSLTLTLEAKAHELRVERNGYDKPAAQQVRLKAGDRQTVAFRLVPQNAGIELTGAPANVELRVNGIPIGRTNGSPTYLFTAPIKPGERSLEAGTGRLQSGQGAGSRSLTVKFEPGQTVRLAWMPPDAAPNPPVPTPTVTPTPAPNPPNPTAKAPTPAEMEELDWEKVHETSDANQLRDFRNKYPNSRHVRDIDAALERLKWAGTKKDSADSLRAYLQEFPNGANAPEANQLLGDLAWNSLDKTNRDQVHAFLDKYPTSPHAPEARKSLDQMASDDVLRRQVLDTLAKLNQELKKKPVKESKVKETWPSISKELIQSLRQPGQEIALNPIDAPKIQGDSATVHCTLTATMNSARNQSMTVVLHYGGGAWVISSLALNK